MVDVRKMKQRYAESKRGGDFWNADVGNTLLYVHGEVLPDDDFPDTEGLNYLPVVVHYGVGKNNQMVICLDHEANPIIKHPYIVGLMKKAKKKINYKAGCPVCQEIAEGGMDEEEADRSRAQTRYLWGVTPICTRADPTDEWRKLSPKPSVTFQGKTIYDGLMDLYCDNGDISATDGAILANIERIGRGKNDTKYKVTADTKTIRKPLVLKGALLKMIKKAIAQGGDCDLFKVVANMIKTNAEASAAVSGIKVDDELDDDIDDDVSDDVDDEELVQDDDDDDIGDEADDEAELDLPDLDESPAKKPAKKPSKKPSKKSKDDEDDDEDDGLDDLAAALEDM